MGVERLLLVILSSAIGSTVAAETFGEWTIGVTNDKQVAYAATMNDSGNILSERCIFSEKSCSWYITTSKQCKAGDEYPVLGNTDMGAASFILICDGKVSDNAYRLTFSNWKEIEALMKESSRIGIAIPLLSDNFVVHRFSLVGMKRASLALEDAFFKGLKEKPKDTVVL